MARPEPVAGVDDYLSHSADSKLFYPEIENINLDGAKTFVFRPEFPEYEDCVDPILFWYSATQLLSDQTCLVKARRRTTNNHRLSDQSGNGHLREDS